MFIADLHIHSKYSRATSKKLDLEHLYIWAQKKGLDLIGTGDFTYPQWFAELEEKLVPEGNGLFRLKEEVARPLKARVPPACRREVRFALQTEISNIYKFGDKVRKVHNVVMFPDLESAGAFGARLGRIGNVTSDGRPILGLDSRDLLEIALECSPETIFIPAHIWTPWFSALGSKSGFDSIEECYRDLTGHIHAVETGLSSDPPMNWRVSSLDRFFLVSNSDAHSPDRLGREATLFDCGLSYYDMLDNMRAGSGVAGTLEFFPEEGKYHLDGHRKCGTRLEPEETLAHDGLCPVCGRPVTVGVLNRVVKLADRKGGERGVRSRDFRSLFSLDQIVAECVGVASRTAKSVVKVYDRMLQTLGPELGILLDLPLEEIGAGPGSTVKTAVERVRSGHVHLAGGFDGEFGVVRVFSPQEKKDLPGGKALFPCHSRHAIPLPSPAATPSPGGRTSYSAATPAETPEPPAPDGAGLNERQLAAVEAPPGRLIVVAGPGTGKTRVLTHRVAHLIESGARPDSIAALTFTRKAGGEIRERVRELLDDEEAAARVFAGTLHSFCLDLLKRHGDAEVNVCTEADRELLASELAQGRAGVKRLLAQIKAGDYPPGYLELLERYGLTDLDLIIPRTVELLNSGAAVGLLDGLDHVLVDEFQDIDEDQYALVKTLGSHAADLMVIGDPNQSIYGFRGASPRFFDEFEEHFAASRITLAANYRSTPEIQRVGAMLLGLGEWDDSLGDHAADIILAPSPTDRAEAEFVAHTIERLVGGTAHFSMDSARVESYEDSEISFGDIAVLTRTAFAANLVEEALDRLGVPVARPARPSGAFEEMTAVFEAAARFSADPADPLARKRLEKWVRDTKGMARGLSFTRLTGTLKRRFPDAEDPLAALLELLYPADISDDQRAAFERLCTGLSAACPTSRDLPYLLATASEGELARAGGEKVLIASLHAAKGLEFDVVFICGLEEGLLPYSHSGEEPDLDEERRLLYVGLTRAKKKLFLTRAEKRTLFGKRRETRPSRFLTEIEERMAIAKRSFKKKQKKPEQKKPEQKLLL